MFKVQSQSLDLFLNKIEASTKVHDISTKVVELEG
jgi:hypothetical protein